MSASKQKLPVPFIVASVIAGGIQPLISLVDTAFAARLSTQDLACLALGGGVASSVGWIGGQVIGGFPGVLRRLRGRDDLEGARRLSGQALALAFVLGLLGLAPVAWLLGEAMPLMAQSEATGSGAKHYLQVRMLGLPFELCGFVVFGVLRAGYQAVWTPIGVMLVALGANAGLNALFVWGFGLGLTGLALGSAIAPLIAVLFGAVVINRWQGWTPRAGLAAVRAMTLDPMTVLSVRLGGMAFWRGLLLNAVLIGSAVYAERFSTAELAAHGLTLQLWLLIAFLVDGFAHAGLAYGSRLIGAGQFDEARRFAWRLIGSSWLLTSIICASLVLSWYALPSIFGLDGTATAAFANLLWPICAQALPASFAFVADGFLKGAGDLRFLAGQMLVASAMVFPLALILLADDLAGLWWAMTAWIGCRALLCIVRIVGDRWCDVARQQMASA